MSGGVVVGSVAGESDDVVVGGNRCAGSVGGVDVFFGSMVHWLVSCAVLQHRRQPILGIGVTKLYNLSVMADMLSRLKVCSCSMVSSSACVPCEFRWFLSSYLSLSLRSVSSKKIVLCPSFCLLSAICFSLSRSLSLCRARFGFVLCAGVSSGSIMIIVESL